MLGRWEERIVLDPDARDAHQTPHLRAMNSFLEMSHVTYLASLWGLSVFELELSPACHADG